MMETSNWWSTEISDISPGIIRFRGYPVEDLIRTATFPSVVWLMSRGDLPTPQQAHLLERALVAGIDHGPQAPSIAIARMAMTCGVGINNAMASAINVLGDVHGGAGQELMELLDSVTDDLEDADDQEALRTAVRTRLRALADAGRYVPGFGHRFHPVDPRRDPLVEAVAHARDQGVVAGKHLAVGLEIERQLAEGRTRPVPMNIDGATAIIYAELGFAPTLGRALFILSRSVGAMAHAWEESGSGMRNKGPEHRTILPRYTGHPPRRAVKNVDHTEQEPS